MLSFFNNKQKKMCLDHFNDSALKIINVIAYVLMVVVRCFITERSSDNIFLYEPFNNETFSNNYLLPKQYTFEIWELIYLLLAGFVIYQFSKAANDVTNEGIECYFCASSILHITWLIVIWVRNQLFFKVNN
jgi:hypothetical protein